MRSGWATHWQSVRSIGVVTTRPRLHRALTLMQGFVPFDAVWITIASLLVTSAGCLARLRFGHPTLWHELGRPNLLPGRSLAPSAALTRFYWSRRVATLGDPSLSRWVTALRVQQVLLAAVLSFMTWHIAKG